MDLYLKVKCNYSGLGEIKMHGLSERAVVSEGFIDVLRYLSKKKKKKKSTYAVVKELPVYKMPFNSVQLWVSSVVFVLLRLSI